MNKVITIAMVMSVGSVAAADAPKIEVPKPAKELENLKGLAKNWSCTGTATLPGPTPVTYSYKSKVKSSWDLSGHWADWRYEREKTKEAPGVTSEGEWGWDSANKRYMMQGMDDWGGYINLTAGSATPEAITFEGELVLMGQKMPVKFAFTYDAKGKKMHMTMTSGANKLLEDDCK
jgi:hypothetical protein